jgi:hypothetical protein
MARFLVSVRLLIPIDKGVETNLLLESNAARCSMTLPEETAREDINDLRAFAPATETVQMLWQVAAGFAFDKGDVGPVDKAIKINIFAESRSG